MNKFVRLSNTLLKDGAPLKLRPYGAKSVYYYYESVRNNHILACNYAKYSPIKKKFQLQTRQHRSYMLPISLLGEQRHDGCEQFA